MSVKKRELKGFRLDTFLNIDIIEIICYLHCLKNVRLSEHEHVIHRIEHPLNYRLFSPIWLMKVQKRVLNSSSLLGMFYFNTCTCNPHIQYKMCFNGGGISDVTYDLNLIFIILLNMFPVF